MVEGLDGALGSIAAKDVGRDKLVLCFPHVFNGRLEVSTDLVVEYFLDQLCGHGWPSSAG